MPRWRGSRKYDPLTAYLRQATVDSVTLTLVEIEALLGAPLPATATSASFWSNYPRTWPAQAWRKVGWRVARHRPRQWVTAVTFLRESAVAAATDPPASCRLRWRALGQRLRAGRQAAGLTQRALGQAVGTSQPRYSEYERGVIRPPRTRLVQLATVLRLDLAAVLALARYQ